MQVQSMHFKRRTQAALANEPFQALFKRTGGGLANMRAKAVDEFGRDEFETLRGAGAAIRDRVLANLDTWIEQFERKASERGTTVLFAESAEDVRALVLDLCRRHGVRKAIKSKSMVSEEVGLNEALEANGVQPVETDLGEYILQLAGEPPSHIIAPAVHKSKDDVSDLFARHHNKPRITDAQALTREAREVLRQHFLSADLGVSGGNFLIAETGSVALVTNEGNGRMVTTLPRVHIAITGIEKVLPTLEDLSTMMRVLPRSATGQAISNYFTVVTGPRSAGELDGPEHMYVILVDSGRTKLLGTDMQEMLRCIRCGACMNHCPVYRTVGGHSYGWVYPGPMGSVLTPSYIGGENALDLPHAATLCNQCGVVCPVKIPLPELLRKLREKQFDAGQRPAKEVFGLRTWAWVARHPRLYALATRTAVRFMRMYGGSARMIRAMPFGVGGGWTIDRDMPAPQGRTFRELYRKEKRERARAAT